MEYNGTSLVLLLAGTLLLLFVAVNLFSLKGFMAFIKNSFLLVCLFLCAGALFTGWDLLNYRQLLEEERVATLSFKREETQQFQVRLIYSGQQAGKPEQFFYLRGDEWQLDVRLIKWNNRLVRFGLKPFYHLDRLSGRYRDVEQAISSSRSVYALYQPVAGFDSWQLAKELPWINRLIDSRYGSAVYLPMADGAEYQVSIGVNGLLAKPQNAAAEGAVQRW